MITPPLFGFRHTTPPYCILPSHAFSGARHGPDGHNAPEFLPLSALRIFRRNRDQRRFISIEPIAKEGTNVQMQI